MRRRYTAADKRAHYTSIIPLRRTQRIPVKEKCQILIQLKSNSQESPRTKHVTLILAVKSALKDRISTEALKVPITPKIIFIPRKYLHFSE